MNLLKTALFLSFTLLNIPLAVKAIENTEHVVADNPIDNWLSDTSPRVSKQLSPIRWTFAHPAPPVSHLPPVWRAGFEWLNKVTQGAITIKEYGGGTLYGFHDGFKAIRAGVADYGTCYTVAESKGFELLKTFQVPYVAPSNPYVTARIINELLATKLKREFLKKGVYPAHIAPVRPLTLMSKTPIRLPEDLRGKKIVSFINIPGADKLLGFAEVRIPFTELYTALQQGLIDAVIWVDMGFVPFKIYEQAKFYTDINIAPLTVDTCMNRKSFDRLPGELKQQVYDLQQKIGIALVNKTENFAKNAKSVLKNNGVTLIELTPKERAQWQSAFQPVVTDWMNACEKAGKDCRELVKEIARLKARYSSLTNRELMDLAIQKPVPGIIDF